MQQITSKTLLKNILRTLADQDPLFAVKVLDDKKNIDDCITYILNTVQASECNGFADDEIFGMAIHYYVEDNVDPGKPVNCKVIVNHQVELTQEEKDEIRKKVVTDMINEERRRMSKPKSNVVTTKVEQASLF